MTSRRLAGATLIRGTAKKNRQQIQDEIDKLKAQLRFRITGTATGANIETSARICPRRCGWPARF